MITKIAKVLGILVLLSASAVAISSVFFPEEDVIVNPDTGDDVTIQLKRVYLDSNGINFIGEYEPSPDTLPINAAVCSKYPSKCIKSQPNNYPETHPF